MLYDTAKSHQAPLMVPAVFLDRDGTLIADRGYLESAAGVALLPGVLESLSRVTELGFALVVVSNQSGIGRGMFDSAALGEVHARFVSLLQSGGVGLAGTFYCPHGPDDGCVCRKPAPGMLLEAARDLGLDLGRSWMIGDKRSDADAGRLAGCRSIRLASGSAAADLRDAVKLIESTVGLLGPPTPLVSTSTWRFID